MGAYQRNFTWKAYCSQKALSLFISLISGGFRGAKQSLKLAKKNIGHTYDIIKKTTANCKTTDITKMVWNSTD